ncbi:Transposable element Hobo transposase [Frankliniella fusca]|uniref:Transposable element Hobo transposase n=1 Tax=Frankliniella fusca TaxID=407009 RepID=A0AAE1LKF7_9NEOP|nr:Transposable element Hobo transposase [Frankliniella fusca]
MMIIGMPSLLSEALVALLCLGLAGPPATCGAPGAEDCLSLTPIDADIIGAAVDAVPLSKLTANGTFCWRLPFGRTFTEVDNLKMASVQALSRGTSALNRHVCQLAEVKESDLLPAPITAREAVLDATAEYVAVDLRPLSIVEGPGFLSLAHTLNDHGLLLLPAPGLF